jgi:hypothetical protein
MLNWCLDGVKIFSISGVKVRDEAAWKAVAHDEHFLLLNVVVGGSWPGEPNNQTIDGPFDWDGSGLCWRLEVDMMVKKEVRTRNF